MKILSGSEAKLAWAKGEDLEMSILLSHDCWSDLRLDEQTLDVFDDELIKFRIKQKLETVEIIPPKKVVLEPVTKSVFLMYDDIDVAKAQMEDIIKQLNLSMNVESTKSETLKEATPKVEVKSKQNSCSCPHWKGSSFFMGDTFTCNDCGGVVMI